VRVTSDAPEFPYTVLRALLSEGHAHTCRAIAVTYAHQSAAYIKALQYVTKKVCFRLPRQVNPAQTPKESSVKGPVDGVCFSRTSTQLCKCSCLFHAFRGWFFSLKPDC